MKKHDTIERIRTVICRVFGLNREHVERTTNLQTDLGADSLDMVEVTMKLEEEFDVKIPDADGLSIRTVDDAAKLVDERSACS